MKKFFRIVLVLAILVGLWFLARYSAQTGPVRRHFADDLAEALGADAVTVESTTLEFPFTFVARGVKATLAASEATVFEAPEIKAGCCWWRIESPTVVAVAKPDGGIVPTFFGPESVRASLDGSGRPCPVGLLSTVADTWEVPSKKFTIRKADVAYRDLDGGVHAVFTGLTWTRRPIRLGKHGWVGYSVAKWTSFGPAVAPDGRPNDGRSNEAEWLGGRGVPVQSLWGPKPPCPGAQPDGTPPTDALSTDAQPELASGGSGAKPPVVAPPAPPAPPAPAPAPTPEPDPLMPDPAFTGSASQNPVAVPPEEVAP